MNGEKIQIKVARSYRTASSTGSGLAASGRSGPSARVQAVAAMFGLGLDEQRCLPVVPETDLSLGRGELVFVTGPSGSGKSTLLRCVASAVAEICPALRRVDFAELASCSDEPLVDAVGGGTLEDALRWLSLAGLNDAFVMLRRPSELSDGQAYRFRLARAMAMVEQGEESVDASDADGPAALLLADEFGAALDRLTAKVVARQLRAWTTQTGACVVAATTHDDLLEALRPDVVVEQRLGGSLVVHRAAQRESSAEEAA